VISNSKHRRDQTPDIASEIHGVLDHVLQEIGVHSTETTDAALHQGRAVLDHLAKQVRADVVTVATELASEMQSAHHAQKEWTLRSAIEGHFKMGMP
jgi:hypothetical protein